MSGRILVVDDEQSMCEMLETALGMRGFDVAWRVRAEQALELLTTEDFDAVLSDLRMPGMSGTELCERISANRADVPVVVMTAFGSLESAVAAIRAGAYDFVTKPIELDMLGISLERAVKHRRLQEQVRPGLGEPSGGLCFGAALEPEPVLGVTPESLCQVGDPLFVRHFRMPSNLHCSVSISFLSLPMT